jgi:formylglycine-generating enzyme required for sulfatase activity
MRPVAGCLERHGYRLPTEAEWEFACRSGVARSRYYGDADALLSHYAWYDANSGQCAQPVGQLMPNDFGLFDMHGNVWEWTNSRYDDYPQGGGTDPDDPTPAQDLGVRILRGGAWTSPVKVVRSAHRYVSLISATNPAHGFRVTRTMEEYR